MGPPQRTQRRREDAAVRARVTAESGALPVRRPRQWRRRGRSHTEETLRAAQAGRSRSGRGGMTGARVT
ncbi:unnamed protein product [Rangifer tarandus platyrhynchus]|uniref:Uncharacterized protein n=2 Tax=Rangifer tarandus platyrhynchus TaxID=3082113 RepID=A0ABN8Y0S3_RANTA|nr:unnamed protein product [Rangifer tarandus platyrhynchus]CAI9692825.1 unnamed protein product [Rangifer tarandus platyrhynchus]